MGSAADSTARLLVSPSCEPLSPTSLPTYSNYVPKPQMATMLEEEQLSKRTREQGIDPGWWVRPLASLCMRCCMMLIKPPDTACSRRHSSVCLCQIHTIHADGTTGACSPYSPNHSRSVGESKSRRVRVGRMPFAI
jgi:hypothetical protein